MLYARRWNASRFSRPGLGKPLLPWRRLFRDRLRVETRHFADKSTLKYAVPSDYFSFLTWGLDLYHKAVKMENPDEAELLYRVSGALSLPLCFSLRSFRPPRVVFPSSSSSSALRDAADQVLIPSSGEEYESAHLLNPKNDDILNNWGCTLDMRARLKKGMLAEFLYHEYVLVIPFASLFCMRVFVQCMVAAGNSIARAQVEFLTDLG